MKRIMYTLLAILMLFSSDPLIAAQIAAGMTTDDNTLPLGAGNQFWASATAPIPTVISDTNYSTSCTDKVLAYSSLSASRTVTLTPCGTSTRLKTWQIKDNSGNASQANPINLASTSGMFDGLTGTAISQARGSKTFYDDGMNFFMMGAFLPSVGGVIQKGDGNGGLMNAVSGTDYVSPSSLGNYVPTTTTVNGHALSSNVMVTSSDLGLATVATSGSYNDLNNRPSIPAAQVNSDWNSVSGLSQILNKPSLATVATSGSYTDLSNKPTIPAAQVNSDWNAVSGLAQILNEPTIPSTAQTVSALSLSLVGSGATGTQISATKNSSVCVTTSTSTTSTIGGPSTSIVMLKTFSSNSATEGNWVLAGQLENDQTITLAVALQSVQAVKGQLCTSVPAGYYVKIENSGTGTHSEGVVTGQQTIYG